MEEALRHSEQQLRALFEFSTDPDSARIATALRIILMSIKRLHLKLQILARPG